MPRCVFIAPLGWPGRAGGVDHVGEVSGASADARDSRLDSRARAPGQSRSRQTTGRSGAAADRASTLGQHHRQAGVLEHEGQPFWRVAPGRAARRRRPPSACPAAPTTMSSERSSNTPDRHVRTHAQRRAAGAPADWLARSAPRSQLLAPRRPPPPPRASARPAPRTARGCTRPGDTPPPCRSTPASSCRRSPPGEEGQVEKSAARAWRRWPPAGSESAPPCGPIVAASNRSVLYSNNPCSLPGVHQGERRSNLAVRFDLRADSGSGRAAPNVSRARCAART